MKIQNPKKILIKGVSSSSHIKINTGIAESLADLGYNVSIVFENKDPYQEKLRLKGVHVYIEPLLEKEYARQLA